MRHSGPGPPADWDGAYQMKLQAYKAGQCTYEELRTAFERAAFLVAPAGCEFRYVQFSGHYDHNVGAKIQLANELTEASRLGWAVASLGIHTTGGWAMLVRPDRGEPLPEVPERGPRPGAPWTPDGLDDLNDDGYGDEDPDLVDEYGNPIG